MYDEFANASDAKNLEVTRHPDKTQETPKKVQTKHTGSK